MEQLEQVQKETIETDYGEGLSLSDKALQGELYWIPTIVVLEDGTNLEYEKFVADYDINKYKVIKIVYDKSAYYNLMFIKEDKDE